MIDNSCRTINKWILFNNCHGLGDGDGLQGFAARVFVFNYYTVSYTLNDRKVIRRILWSVKNARFNVFNA